MPPHDPDREAELAALQTAFDEYIASSRELEDELDAELAKMREYNYNWIVASCVISQCRLITESWNCSLGPTRLADQCTHYSAYFYCI